MPPRLLSPTVDTKLLAGRHSHSIDRIIATQTVAIDYLIAVHPKTFSIAVGPGSDSHPNWFELPVLIKSCWKGAFSWFAAIISETNKARFQSESTSLLVSLCSRTWQFGVWSGTGVCCMAEMERWPRETMDRLLAREGTGTSAANGRCLI
jgi:hypothetical protein